eukprot:5405919-Alexandrium_andersonii.AAC.1
MGNAQRQLQGQIRTLRAEAESRIGCSATPDTHGWPWMVRHSGWLLERFSIRASGSTSYRDIVGHGYNGV